MILWSGRFQSSLDSTAAQLNASLPVDQRLAAVDIYGSQAWAAAIFKAGILSENEHSAIQDGLKKVLEEFEQALFQFQPTDEDIHTAVERRLTELIGPVGGKLHTGRSRNDQVATDFRLWLMIESKKIAKLLIELQTALVERAEVDISCIIPGYTHTQQAQPILLSHWWLSHFWALQRDLKRLENLQVEIAVLPLGSAALAGTTVPIDRFALCRDLGFAEPAPNSVDAVSDRDFAADFLYFSALLGIHLSRLSEALILYTTQEFSFFSLPDEYSTGSSIMPQKKNPDMLELIRGKSGTAIGKLTGLLATLKGLSSAYDKDLQEDKQPVIETVDMLMFTIPVMAGLISKLTINEARLEKSVDVRVFATDLADYLVSKHVPFREAHHAVGQAVRRSETLRVTLDKLPMEEWQSIHPLFQNDLYNIFSLTNSIALHSAYGGTAPNQVLEQIKMAQQILQVK